MRYGVSGTSSIPSLMGPTQQLARQAGPPGVMPGPGGPGPGPVLGPTGPRPYWTASDGASRCWSWDAC